MRVLFVTQSDPRGSVHRLARLLRAQGLAQARVMMLSEPQVGGPAADLARLHDGGDELKALLAEADVLHLVDLVPSALPVVQAAVRRRTHPPRWVLQWDRVPFRSEAREIDELRDRAHVKTIETRPDAIPDPDGFLPPVVATRDPPWMPLLPGTHARARRGCATIFASARRSLRDDPRLESLVEQAENVAARRGGCRVEVFAGRPDMQALQRQRRAHMVLTTAARGLPLVALEGLAQGLRVVVDGPVEHREAYAALAGGTPAPVLSPQDMPRAIAELDAQADPDMCTVAWARAVLDPRRWLGACLRLYEAPSVVASRRAA